MTDYQRAKRIAHWRGSAETILAFTVFMIASALAGALTN